MRTPKAIDWDGKSSSSGKRKGAGPRLNDCQRMEILSLLEQPNPVSMRSIGRQYGVDEKTIRKVKVNKNIILDRVQKSTPEAQEKTFRATKAMFPEVEEKLSQWIQACQRGSLPLSSTLICHKAILIAESLGVTKEKFKASWGWYTKFRNRYSLLSANLVGDGEEVDKSDQKMRKTCQEISLVVSQYDVLISEKHEMEQSDVIHNSLQEVMALDMHLSGLKESKFLSLDQVNEAKSAFLRLRQILEIGSNEVTQAQLEKQLSTEIITT